MATIRKGGGGNLSRTETITVRLDPKLRFAAELAARKQRRTLSSLIEWAIEDALKRYEFHEGDNYTNEPSISAMDAANYIWDVDEADRFVKLAIRWPDLLTHDEQVLWKLIKETTWLWGKEGLQKKETGSGKDYLLDNFHFLRLRFFLQEFKSLAQGKEPTKEGPKWPKNGPSGDDILPAPQWQYSRSARLEMEALGTTPPEGELFASDGYDWPHGVKNPIRQG